MPGLIEADGSTAARAVLRVSAVFGFTAALARTGGAVTDGHLEFARACGLSDDEIIGMARDYARTRGRRPLGGDRAVTAYS
ncbi:hypothetical protein OHB26_10300 [Nocardia sp. NBC_01503]|uniref:hypothetical protein n=1 Tax=Nocardia sp. NBC_01503 TaxID=2975997 RepID=UPI002E7AC2D8|nr:hypothetical protein [Nocardia sp. NBC_01503]WTL34546.1 hypothetical protein OHB26_10300 [Nocardia sp. NBC_01503]